MANNGYLVGDSCSSVKEKSISICSTANAANDYAIPHFRFGSVSSVNVQCYSSVSGVRVSYSIPAFDCEIPGPPLTETQQIEAINALFPSAIAILAIAWGFKYIRVLVAEWLKERNASD